MDPLMDIKVFNTNLRFVLIFNHINMNGIMTEIILRSFISSLSFIFYSFTPEIQMKGAFLCSLGIYAKPFPIRQYFDKTAG